MIIWSGPGKEICKGSQMIILQFEWGHQAIVWTPCLKSLLYARILLEVTAIFPIFYIKEGRNLCSVITLVARL